MKRLCVCVYCMQYAPHIYKHMHVGCANTHNTSVAFRTFSWAVKMLEAEESKRFSLTSVKR